MFWMPKRQLTLILFLNFNSISKGVEGQNELINLPIWVSISLTYGPFHLWPAIEENQ